MGSDCGILPGMVLRRFLGAADRDDAPSSAAVAARAGGSGAAETDTATIRRIVTAIEALPAEQRRYVAGFAYVLGRAAHADLRISDDERKMMEQTVWKIGGLSEAQAVLVVEIAVRQNELYGGTEDYLVTRDFTDATSEEQRLSLLRCAFAIGAAEGAISAEESAELNQIGKELGIASERINAVRAEFTDQFQAVQRMRRLTGTGGEPMPEDPPGR
ncbi:hypothetical protein BH18CHL1_BH18CHL1_07970 [soil metagenome]